jgi:hypothetical protein
MSWLEGFFGFLLLTFYIMALFTVCRLTFAKGYTAVGIIGIFVPFLWLVGAILPAKPGSRFQVQTEMLRQAQAQQFSS